MALKLESKDSVLIATINRPARKNAVDQETLAELANAGGSTGFSCKSLDCRALDP